MSRLDNDPLDHARAPARRTGIRCAAAGVLALGALGAGIGYLVYQRLRMVLAARAAIRDYDSRVDPVLAAEIWAEGDREHA